MIRGLLVFLGIFLFSLGSEAGDRNVTLMIYVDYSPSMSQKREQLAKIVPRIAKAMENTCGNYRFAINNILYNDLPTNLSPIGSPAFVDKSTPNGLELLKERILAPFDPAHMDNSGFYRGREEITYSTVSRSLLANITELQDQDMVSALIVSDAIPVFEFGSPDEELHLVQSVLGSTRFMSGAFGGFLETGVEIPKDSKTPGCFPDNLGKKGIDQTAWLNNNLLALQKFTQGSGGWTWDICADDFDSSVDDFIMMLIGASECMPMM